MSNYSITTSSELQKLSHKNQVRFALFCAKAVSHLNPNHEIQLAIKTVELWLDNKATAEECKKAADAAYAYADAAYATDYASYAGAHAAYAGAAYADADAASYAAGAAAHAGCAAHAARAASYAAAAYAGAHAAAAKNKAIQAQREYYDSLLYINENFEKIILA